MAQALPSIALVGTGGYGAYHLRSLELMRAEGRGRLLAVADPSLVPGSSAAAAFLAAGVRPHPDLPSLLAAGDLDLVVLVTPIPLHEEMALQVLAAGVPLLLEKPPVPTPRQLHRLVAADPRGRAAVAFQMILNPALRSLKRALLEGRLGVLCRITAGACWPRGDGYYARADWAGRLAQAGRPVFDGPASNGLAHLLHNAAWLASPSPEGFAPPAAVLGELHRARPGIESSDTCALRARLGPRGEIEFAAAFTHACDQELPWEMRLSGTRGEARLVDNGARLLIDGETVLACEPDEDRHEIYRDTLRHLAGLAPRPATRLADCLPYLRVVSGLHLSSGGVHLVPREHVTEVEAGPARRYVLAGIAGAVRRTLATGELFSEQGLPWARPGREVPAAALDDTA